MNSIATCLLFLGEQAGKAEEAITLYTSVFQKSEIVSVEKYGAAENDKEGLVKIAKFLLNGVEFMAMDSSLDHQFTFTPAVSLYVECESLGEIERAYWLLLDGGSELMPLDDYGMGQRFGWLNDRYGVSWQLNLA